MLRAAGIARARTFAAVGAIAVLTMALGSELSHAQASGEGWQTIDKSPPRAPSPVLPPVAPNTTVVPRAVPDSAAQAEIQLEGYLTDDGQRLDQGLVWRIYQGRTADGRVKLLSTHRDPTPKVRVPVGEYVVNVTLGRAHLTRQVAVKAGLPTKARFVLNAGGLRIAATLVTGEPLPDRAVLIDVLAGERDQSGERARILSGVRPGLVIRLNAGIYHLVSTYGDANAVVQSDITVEAGKVTEATVVHHAARTTLKLVARAGGEALADTQWAIATPQGEVVKETVGALPTHILAPGTYAVTARHGGQSFRRDVTLTAGEVAEVEVVMQ